VLPADTGAGERCNASDIRRSSEECGAAYYCHSGPGTDYRYNGRKPLWFRIYYDGSANDATTLFAKRKVFRSPKTAASGIGDEAYFDRGGALHARKGNARFYLDVGTDRQEPAVTKLGEIVAGQL
jgi:hypothetical protein